MKCLAIGLGALVFAQAAAASPCSDKIARLQSRSDAASSASDTTTTAGGAAETADAKLHHQPAPAGKVSAAGDSEAALRNARFQNDLFNAQAAEHSGDMAGCEAAAAAAEKELPR